MPANPAALQAYRQLMRAAQKTFKGDTFALQTVRGEVRTQFHANKAVSSGEVNQKIADAYEARDFIVNNIVQGKKTSCGTIELSSAEDAKRLEEMTAPEVNGGKSSA